MLFSVTQTGLLPSLLLVRYELAELVINEPEANRHHLIMEKEPCGCLWSNWALKMGSENSEPSAQIQPSRRDKKCTEMTVTHRVSAYLNV